MPCLTNRIKTNGQIRLPFWHDRILFFSALCGTGKTAMAVSLLKGHDAYMISASDPDALVKPIPDRSETVVIDDFQYIKSEGAQSTVLAWLYQYPKIHFIFLIRGILPGWLISYRLTGILIVIDMSAFALDKDVLRKELGRNNVSLSDENVRNLLHETNGYALGIALLIHRIKDGASCSKKLYEEAELELFRYSGDLNRVSAVFFWHWFRLRDLMRKWQSLSVRIIMLENCFFEWELIQQESTDAQNEIYRRAGHYYELHDEYADSTFS